VGRREAILQNQYLKQTKDKNMKTRHQTEVTPTTASWRNPTAPDITNGDPEAIRPFRVNIPEAELTELRRRINATRWPDRETVPDQSQGVQLATIQALARYWGTEYDWS